MIGTVLNRLIVSSERETLLYKNLQFLKYKIGKLANFNKHINIQNKLERAFKNLDDKSRKIQFGAGSGHYGEAAATEIDGFVDSDIFGELPIDVSKKLPIKSASIDIIFSSHLIEHLHQIEIDKFLSESFRTLKQDGKFIVACPSLEKAVKLAYGKDSNIKKEFFEVHGIALLGRKPTPARVLNCLLHINYGHKFVHDFETFSDLAKKAGFKESRIINVKEISDTGLKTYFERKPKHYWFETEIWCAIK